MTWDPKKTLVQIQVQPDFADLLQTIADREERSRNQQLVFMLKQHIAAHYPELVPDTWAQPGPRPRSNNGGKPANKEK